jgi:hypothetical protein
MTYQSKAMYTTAVLASLSLALMGCTGSTIHKTSSLGEVQTLSLDAKQRLVITGHNSDGNNVVCAEPSPDALVAQAAVLSASGKYNAGEKGPEASGGAGVGIQESAASIGIRTQNIQILRDGYYRLCESYLNGAISEKEYHDVVTNLDTFIIVALAVDGLGNTKAAPNVALGSGTVNYGAAAGTDTASATGAIGAATSEFHDAAAAGNATDKTAPAIAQIVRDYLNYKEDSYCIASKKYCRRLAVSNVIK